LTNKLWRYEKTKGALQAEISQNTDTRKGRTRADRKKAQGKPGWANESRHRREMKWKLSQGRGEPCLTVHREKGGFRCRSNQVRRLKKALIQRSIT